MRLARSRGWIPFGLAAAALTTLAFGCELIACAGHGQTSGNGGAGGAGASSSSTTTSSSSSTTTTSSSSTTASSSSGTGGAGTGGSGTGGMGTGGMGTGGTNGTGGGDAGTCTTGQKLCNNTCVGVNDPAFGCGATTCTPCNTTNATATCNGQTCALQCNTNFGDCNNDPSDGCETDLTTPINCGACNHTCTAPDQCHTFGTCNPSTMTCSYNPRPDTTPCNDGNLCTQNETCVGGTCTGGTPVTCTAMDQCHTAGTCDMTTGLCSNPAKANGTACSDGNACTLNDTCVGGTCTSGAPVTCTAQDQCHTAGTCDMTTGLCSNPAKANGTACNDGNPCTQTDTCVSGVCTGGNPVTCTAMDQCHVAGTCNPATGTCSNPNQPNGTTCTGTDLCMQTNQCQAGVCTGSNPVTCSAMDQCHVAGTCNSATGMCSNPDQTDGTACNDGNSCTLTAACETGTCTTMTSLTCATNTCGTSLVAFNLPGTQTAGWSINGAAAYDSGTSTLVLTSGASMAEAGTVFYQDPIVADAFTVSFDFMNTTTNGRADGIAFTMQTNGPTAIGAAFGGFGVMNLTGYAVELDIFDSGPCDPGNGNHASVDLLSPCSTNNGIPSPVNTSPDLFGLGVGDIGDGAWRTATIQLASGALSVTITNSSGTPITVTNLQSVSLPSFTSGTPYYIGFGGGSGSNALYARQEIRNVNVTFPSLHCL